MRLVCAQVISIRLLFPSILISVWYQRRLVNPQSLTQEVAAILKPEIVESQ